MITSKIEERLSEMNAFDDKLIEENACPELCILLNGLMEEKNISRPELIRKLNVDQNYGYQLLNGTRTPTRERLIKIGLILGLDVEQLQKLLKTAQKESLYVRNLVDAKVFYAVKHRMKYDDAVPFIWGRFSGE